MQRAGLEERVIKDVMAQLAAVAGGAGAAAVAGPRAYGALEE
jgi:hypothetical protein